MGAAPSELPAGPRPVIVDAAGVERASCRGVLDRKIRATISVTSHHQPTILENYPLRMRLDERVAPGNLDGVVSLPTARPALLAVEAGRPGWTSGPRQVDARVAVAAAAIHRFASASAVPPDAGTASLWRAGGLCQRIQGRVRVKGGEMHDPDYQRPICSRYIDPLEVVWMATARRLGIRIRRNPQVFSMTDGAGLLELGPRESLDPDDTAAQQIFHELCHWITNGLDSFHQRDWGFPLTDELDWREYGCLRFQAGLADRYGLRKMLGPTGIFRQYFDRIPADALAPFDDSELELYAVKNATEALQRVNGEPWREPMRGALLATRALRDVVHPFLESYQTDLEADELPSLWAL